MGKEKDLFWASEHITGELNFLLCAEDTCLQPWQEKPGHKEVGSKIKLGSN